MISNATLRNRSFALQEPINHICVAAIATVVIIYVTSNNESVRILNTRSFVVINASPVAESSDTGNSPAAATGSLIIYRVHTDFILGSPV